jgi:chloramphenicol-sensitive protein RarD
MTERARALGAAILAFSFWGLFPIYWKLFPELSGESLFMHRLFWSLVTLVGIVGVTGKWDRLKALAFYTHRKWLVLSALLIASNWLLYVVAVTQGHILEASMGYFLNPLLNVCVGAIFLKEKLRSLQWVAVAIAVGAVSWLLLQAGLAGFPWVALTLSLTFASYGVIRKFVAVGALEGLAFETIAVFPFFFAWWIWQGGDIAQDIALIGIPRTFLLSLSGAVTSLPLVLFAYAARRLPLQTLGFTQYLSPSLKFLCGWWLFNEPLPPERLQAFLLIWLALAVYTTEGVWRTTRAKPMRVT